MIGPRTTALLAVALCLPTAAAQDEGRMFYRTRAFSFEPPAGWRLLTPGEALTLKKSRARVTPDLLLEGRPEDYPYGAIDRWLAGDFDGRSMVVGTLDGECPTNDEGIATLRDHVLGGNSGGIEVVSLATTTIGTADHPAIEGTTRQVSDGQPMLSLVLFVPSGGDTTVLTFRALESDFEAALPVFRSAISSLIFARKPRGEASVGDRLLYPLVIGALVGVLLLVLHGHRRAAMRDARSSP